LRKEEEGEMGEVERGLGGEGLILFDVSRDA
jgi:hypothetical protein